MKMSPRIALLSRYQLYVYYWHGNSAALSLHGKRHVAGRMVVHGAASLVRAMLRPLARIATGDRPQLRFALAQILHATGKMLGTTRRARRS